MSTSKKQLCFVIMGFGKKTDYETGRTLDLNETYTEIIKPAVEEAGFECIRADAISHSGIIDLPMYQMLLEAELVVADISTGNVNAVYELGVRHALKRRSTIIMKESDGRLSFDLNHVATFSYKHLGEEIGAKEARRAKADLLSLIKSIAESDSPDSPLYTFLPQLRMPSLTEEEREEIIEIAEEKEEDLLKYIEDGEEHLKQSHFQNAVVNFQNALKMKPNEPFLIQRLTLVTYKSKSPSELDSLFNALHILSVLKPEVSNDPETTGLAGAIYKRLWLLSKDCIHLDKSLDYYNRGFVLKKDYYNGENLASCYDIKYQIEENHDKKIFFKESAKKIREDVYQILQKFISNQDFADRRDKKWIYASMANICSNLQLLDDASKYENLFLKENPADWEKDTYFQNKKRSEQP